MKVVFFHLNVTHVFANLEFCLLLIRPRSVGTPRDEESK